MISPRFGAGTFRHSIQAEVALSSTFSYVSLFVICTEAMILPSTGEMESIFSWVLIQVIPVEDPVFTASIPRF